MRRIDPHDAASRQGALGDWQGVSDWNRMYSKPLADQPWRAVVERWMSRLLPVTAAA